MIEATTRWPTKVKNKDSRDSILKMPKSMRLPDLEAWVEERAAAT